MGSLSSIIGSIYCTFSIMGSLSSIIGSIYCTSGVIYPTGSPASLGAFPAFSIIVIFVIGSLYRVIESIPGIMEASTASPASLGGSPYCFSSIYVLCCWCRTAVK